MLYVPFKRNLSNVQSELSTEEQFTDLEINLIEKDLQITDMEISILELEGRVSALEEQEG